MGDNLIPELPPLKSINGIHDAYCRVCWEPVYRFWVSKEDHGGVCTEGVNCASDCSNARAMAHNAAVFAKIRAEIGADIATRPTNTVEEDTGHG